MQPPVHLYIYYCIQKRASELKVCSGWFGLREHKVRCEKASVATTARQKGWRCLMNAVWSDSLPYESASYPGGQAGGFVPGNASNSSLMPIKGTVGDTGVCFCVLQIRRTTYWAAVMSNEAPKICFSVVVLITFECLVAGKLWRHLTL